MKARKTFLWLAPWIIFMGYIVYNETRPKPLYPPLLTPPPFLPSTESSDGLNNEEGPAIAPLVPFYNAISWDIPSQLTFAGESVPLQIADVRERFDRELHINTYWHNNTIFLLKRANRWLPVMEPILARYGIPDDFKYLAVIESDLLNKVSPAKAAGFWQILEPTAKELGLEISRDVDERYDPWKATEAACRYLLQAYQKFGNWTLVAASYNRGMKGMENALADQREKDYYRLMLNEETSRYLFRILAAKEIMNAPEKYGFFVAPDHLYEPWQYRTVSVKADINDLVGFAKSHGTDYKTLRLMNPWIRNDRLNVRRNHSYEIKLPL